MEGLGFGVQGSAIGPRLPDAEPWTLTTEPVVIALPPWDSVGGLELIGLRFSLRERVGSRGEFLIGAVCDLERERV